MSISMFAPKHSTLRAERVETDVVLSKSEFAKAGDYIIYPSQGQPYIIAADMFEKYYNPVCEKCKSGAALNISED
jgi:hypothetical protein